MRITACVACSLTTIFDCCSDTLPARDNACCCITAVVADCGVTLPARDRACCSMTAVVADCVDAPPAGDNACCSIAAVVAASSAGEGIEGFGAAAPVPEDWGSGSAAGGFRVATDALVGASVSGEVASGEVFVAPACER